jgi:hypothetical protein
MHVIWSIVLPPSAAPLGECRRPNRLRGVSESVSEKRGFRVNGQQRHLSQVIAGIMLMAME